MNGLDDPRWPPRPTLSSHFYKAHGLGNDYLVFEESRDDVPGWAATPANVARVCDPHRGVGSDGIVVLGTGGGQVSRGRWQADLRMFNPDGGEFERSGNGLRVLGAYLAGKVPELSVIEASVGGGSVTMRVHGRSGPEFDISVEMGRATVSPEAVGAGSGVLRSHDHSWSLAGPDGGSLEIVPVSVGNPHVVVLADGTQAQAFDEARLASLGPFLAAHPGFAHGTNVQLARRSDGGAAAFIWERGVGRTAASGTSACAVAVAMVRSGRCPSGVIPVDMPGGRLLVTVGDDLDVVLRGPVEAVLTGRLDSSLLATFEPAS